MNKEELINHGWIATEVPNTIFYTRTIVHNGEVFHCQIEEGSNTPGRNYSLHVDNEDWEGIGGMDIANFDQLYKFLDLLSE